MAYSVLPYKNETMKELLQKIKRLRERVLGGEEKINDTLNGNLIWSPKHRKMIYFKKPHCQTTKSVLSLDNETKKPL